MLHGSRQAEPGSGSPPSWCWPVVKYPLFIVQTPVAVWFHHGFPEGEGTVADEEIGYILIVIG